MHRLKLINLIILIFLVSCGSSRTTSGVETQPKEQSAGASAGAAEEFAFAVMGDSRDSGPGGVNAPTLKKILDHVREQKRAELVIYSGDMVQGSARTDELQAQIDNWKEIVRPYREGGLEFLITSGNHDIVYGAMEEFEPTRFGKPTPLALANQKVVLEAFADMPKNGPPNGGLTYWVRKGDVLIVVLDCYRPGYFNSVDIDWLRETLSGPAAQPPPSHVFVTTHSPAFPSGGHELDSLPNYNADRSKLAQAGMDIWPWSAGDGGPRDVDVDWRKKRDELWEVLAEHKVKAFLAGHEHNLSYQKVDGVWHIVSGALTKRLYPINQIPIQLYDGKPLNPRAGDTFWSGSDKIWGYFLVSVKKEEVVAEIWGWTAENQEVRLIKKFPLD